MIRISVSQVSAKVRYQVFSSLGRKILHGTFTHQTMFGVSVLASGIYFIKLVADDRRAVKKIIKQ